MPFISRLPCLAAILAVCACLPPSDLANVAKSAASTLFEAAPLLIGAEIAGRLIRRPRSLPWLTTLAGCGCGSLPGALAVPAAALCALTFGPAAALFRCLAAFTLMKIRRKECRADRVASPCILDQLGTVALVSWIGALFLALIRAQAFELTGTPAPSLFVLGVILGLLTPCTVGALAIAAGLRASAAPLALGVLWSTGLLPAIAFHANCPTTKRFDGRFPYVIISLSCLIVVLGGGAGLIHPKFTPLVAGGGVVALIAAFGSPEHVRFEALFAALLMLAAPILHAPAPSYNPGETTLESIYPTQKLRFTGELTEHAGGAMLLRYAVTCCRADASPLALRLDRHPRERNGAWIQADGIVERDATGLRLHVSRYRRIAQPSDPFLYQ